MGHMIVALRTGRSQFRQLSKQRMTMTDGISKEIGRTVLGCGRVMLTILCLFSHKYVLCIYRAVSLLVNINFYTSGLNSKSGRVLSPKIEGGCQGRNAQELLDSGRLAVL